MAIGPVQLIVLGFDQPKPHGEIIAELERLGDSDTVRVIDAVAVYKEARSRAHTRAIRRRSRCSLLPEAPAPASPDASSAPTLPIGWSTRPSGPTDTRHHAASATA